MRWDHDGAVNEYRMGADDCYDLQVIAQPQKPVCGGRAAGSGGDSSRLYDAGKQGLRGQQCPLLVIQSLQVRPGPSSQAPAAVAAGDSEAAPSTAVDPLLTVDPLLLDTTSDGEGFGGAAAEHVEEPLLPPVAVGVRVTLSPGYLEVR